MSAGGESTISPRPEDSDLHLYDWLQSVSGWPGPHPPALHPQQVSQPAGDRHALFSTRLSIQALDEVSLLVSQWVE